MNEATTLNKIKIDLIVIGNPNSGKTSLIRRFIDGQRTQLASIESFSHFYNPTLGLSLQKKVMIVDDTQVTACIWDTAGQQKFFSLTKNYFKKADGVLVVYDLTDKNSFDSKLIHLQVGIQRFWINEIKQKSDEDCSQILIGNKVDMEHQRAVQSAMGKQLAQKLNLRYFQTSAKTGLCVNEAIEYLIRDCLSKVKDSQPRGVEVNLQPKGNSSCFSSSRQLFSELLDRITGK